MGHKADLEKKTALFADDHAGEVVTCDQTGTCTSDEQRERNKVREASQAQAAQTRAQQAALRPVAYGVGGAIVGYVAASFFGLTPIVGAAVGGGVGYFTAPRS